jgi:aspartate racemase
MEKVIIIGGGVGPLAGVELHKKIIEYTLTDGTDQSHLEVYHLSCSRYIPDRTEFLLGNINTNPAQGMFRTIQIAGRALEFAGKEAVAGIPCNTFHAPEIFSPFLELLKRNKINVAVLHMLKETAALILQIAPGAKNIGLMSTTGTRTAGVYNMILQPLGFKIIQVPPEVQAELHDSIYNKDWGIKAVTPVSSRVRNNFINYAQLLVDRGAEAIILGCTEIPLALWERELAGVVLIDPVAALARALILKVGGNKRLKPLKPLSGTATTANIEEKNAY